MKRNVEIIEYLRFKNIFFLFIWLNYLLKLFLVVIIICYLCKVFSVECVFVKGK